jgi:radical SAM protein with 4Fe4S-binding SPASM domain
MEWDLYQKIVKEMASEKHLYSVVYELHNEPLLDVRIVDFIKYLKTLNSKKRCVLVTNGEFLDKFTSEEIIESDLIRLTVSLNAHSKQTYESINIGLDYERVMHNVSQLAVDNALKHKLKLSFVITEQNKDDVHQALQYWRRRGIDTRVVGLVNRAGSLDNYECLRPKESHQINMSPAGLWAYTTSKIIDLTGCYEPFYKMNILFNGDIIICCHDWERTTIVGNVEANSLREVWNSDAMNKIRRAILTNNYEIIDACRMCSLANRW